LEEQYSAKTCFPFIILEIMRLQMLVNGFAMKSKAKVDGKQNVSFTTITFILAYTVFQIQRKQCCISKWNLEVLGHIVQLEITSRKISAMLQFHMY